MDWITLYIHKIQSDYQNQSQTIPKLKSKYYYAKHNVIIY